MNKIVWTNDYSVGVHSLDEQHKKIIELINILIEHHNDSVDSETVFNVLQEMMKYAQQHLDDEEQLLEGNDYPDLMRHTSVHIAYLEKVSEFSFEVMAHNNNVSTQLLEFLKDWWIHHILHEDMKYRPFFELKGIQ
jgi:hemerythrin